jgi:predicted  nucleic acid-binding Zn-ribbon protein
MYLPSFRHLIEIEALKKLNNQNLTQISSENKRISDLEERRAKTTLLIETHKQEEKELHLSLTLGDLSSLEARLKKLNEQLSLAVTEKEQIAFENQIHLVKKDIESKESLYFKNLETSESLLEEIEAKKEFLSGSMKTLDDIKAEVAINIANEQKIIDNRVLRISALMELVAKELSSLYLQIEKKFKPKSPISYLIDKKCSECHMQTDSQLKSSLEEGRSIEFCPTCGRLLIPETAKIY